MASCRRGSWSVVAAAALAASACTPDGPADAGTGSTSGSTAAPDTESSGSTTSGTSSSSTAPTTGASTGEPDQCAPSQGPIPVDEFAVTYAEAICAQKEACGCEVDFGCAGVLSQGFTTIVDYATEQGLAYDPECAGHILAVTVTTRGCGVRSEFYDDFACYQSCQLFQGDVPAGGACPSEQELEFVYYVDSCAGDERCLRPEDVCGVYEPPILQLGDECFSPMVGLLGECEEGTRCNFDTYLCAQQVGEGESCADGLLCAYPFWCNAQSVCQAELAAGEACTHWSQCASWRCAGTCSDTITVCELDEPIDLFRLPLP